MRTVAAVLVLAMVGGTCSAQEPAKFAAFDVASVKENKSEGQVYMNFPLGPGDVYAPNGGYFKAIDLPLSIYITFAYKVQGGDVSALRAQMPDWAKSTNYDIEARVEGDPTKDDMRAMMRALLAERFGLKMHTETREGPVLDLVLVKPGMTGKRLRQHPENDSTCPQGIVSDVMNGKMAMPEATADGYPGLCGGITGMAAGQGRVKVGGRDITMGAFASFIGGMVNLGKPVVDKTELVGKYDFTLEFAPDPSVFLPGSNFVPDETAPSVLNALTEQMGLKLVADKGRVETLVFDHIEHLKEN